MTLRQTPQRSSWAIALVRHQLRRAGSGHLRVAKAITRRTPPRRRKRSCARDIVAATEGGSRADVSRHDIVADRAAEPVSSDRLGWCIRRNRLVAPSQP
jgi:hypothetical protein